MTALKLYEAVAKFLVGARVSHIFGVMGDGNLGYIAEYLKSGRGQYVPTAVEGGAVSMADGYSRGTGKVGVATVTHGPGVTNALTALTEASRSSVPVVLLTGETPAGRMQSQALDLRAAAGLTGVSYRRIQSSGSVSDQLGRAFREAYLDECPVLVDIPGDLMHMDAEWEPSRAINDIYSRHYPRPGLEDMDRALGVMLSAKRPIILVGRGAVSSGAGERLVRMSERLGAPLATSVMALDYFRGQPGYLGTFGSESNSVASTFIAEADCIVAVGVGLNNYTTLDGDLLRGKTLVRCDSSSLALAAGPQAAVEVVADAKAFVDDVIAALADVDVDGRSGWMSRAVAAISEFVPAAEFVDRSDSAYLDVRRAMMLLDRVLPVDRAVVTDVGRAKTAAWRYLHCAPGQFSQTGGFGSVGLALATSIGMSFGRRDGLTVGVMGDGALAMGLMELRVAVENELPLLVVVMNDSSYGAEYDKLKESGFDPSYSIREWPSFEGLAGAFGCQGMTAHTEADIDLVGKMVSAGGLPLLVDIPIDVRVNSRLYK